MLMYTHENKNNKRTRTKSNEKEGFHREQGALSLVLWQNGTISENPKTQFRFNSVDYQRGLIGVSESTTYSQQEESEGSNL